MTRVEIDPYVITVDENEDGEWSCTAVLNQRQLFRDIPYGHLAMTLFLIEKQIDQLEGEISDDFSQAAKG